MLYTLIRMDKTKIKKSKLNCFNRGSFKTAVRFNTNNTSVSNKIHDKP